MNLKINSPLSEIRLWTNFIIWLFKGNQLTKIMVTANRLADKKFSRKNIAVRFQLLKLLKNTLTKILLVILIKPVIQQKIFGTLVLIN